LIKFVFYCCANQKYGANDGFKFTNEVTVPSDLKAAPLGAVFL